MRRPLFWIVAVAVILAAVFFVARPSCAQEMTSNFSYQFGLRQVTSDSLRPALEFNLRYELGREFDDVRWHHFQYAITASGYQTFSEAIRDVDHMELGLAILGKYYSNDVEPLRPEVADYYLELLARSEAGGGMGITESEEAALIELMDRIRRNRKFFAYSVYGRLVTDQQMENKLIDFGLGIQTEIPFLAVPLDYLMSKTRGGDSFVAQPVRAALAVEYVKGIAGREDDYPRGWAEILFSSRVFDMLYPRVKYQAEYDTKGPADADFNHFLDAGVALPVTANTSVVFKYIYGRTAPNYELVNGAVLGFDISSW